MTIEHDPEAISRRIQSLHIPQHTQLPLTTTSSDTNIPNTKAHVLLDTRLSGSTEDLHSSHEVLNEINNAELVKDYKGVSTNNAISHRTNNKGATNKLSPENKERLFKRRDEGKRHNLLSLIVSFIVQCCLK